MPGAGSRSSALTGGRSARSAAFPAAPASPRPGAQAGPVHRETREIRLEIRQEPQRVPEFPPGQPSCRQPAAPGDPATSSRVGSSSARWSVFCAPRPGRHGSPCFGQGTRPGPAAGRGLAGRRGRTCREPGSSSARARGRRPWPSVAIDPGLERVLTIPPDVSGGILECRILLSDAGDVVCFEHRFR